MSRYPPLPLSEIERLFVVDVGAGRVYWRAVAKQHARLNGQEAGGIRDSGKPYWVIKVNKRAYRRAQIVLAVASGQWPVACVDHINGDSLDDRGSNLRHASVAQNAMNHKRRSKRERTPMGVRATASGKFAARISCSGRQHHLGVFGSAEAAELAYQSARKEFFGDYA